MNLVVGATGILGMEICRQLAAKAKPVRALARATSDPGKVEALRAIGAEVVQGDIRDRPSLDAACRGATAIISTVSAIPFSYHPPDSTPLTVDQEGTSNLIDAARAAGVPRFVYTSFTHAMDVDCALRSAKRTVERRLAESGLTYTMLLPTPLYGSVARPDGRIRLPERPRPPLW